MTETNGVPSPRLLGQPPIVSRATRLLVLGSFPGAASLARQQAARLRAGRLSAGKR